MGMPLADRTNWTVDEIHAIPQDGNRYEVIDGELLVTPAPTNLHQRTVLRMAYRLHQYAESVGQEVLVAPTAVRWSAHTELQPDVLAMPLVDGKPAESFESVGRLTLAIEVLSPSTTRSDRFTKRREYQARGVPEYWIVDTDSRSVERWTPGAEVPDYLYETIEWQPDDATPPLTIDLVSFFREVRGE